MESRHFDLQLADYMLMLFSLLSLCILHVWLIVFLHNWVLCIYSACRKTDLCFLLQCDKMAKCNQFKFSWNSFICLILLLGFIKKSMKLTELLILKILKTKVTF